MRTSAISMHARAITMQVIAAISEGCSAPHIQHTQLPHKPSKPPRPCDAHVAAIAACPLGGSAFTLAPPGGCGAIGMPIACGGGTALLVMAAAPCAARAYIRNNEP